MTLSEPINGLRFISVVNCHIEEIDLCIQNDSSLIEEYISCCKNITSCPDFVLNYLIKQKIYTDYPKIITDMFYKNKEYVLYVIGKSLNDKTIVYEKEIGIEVYQNCFINNDKYFELVKNNSDVLEKIYNGFKTYKDLDIDRLLAFSEFPQQYKLSKVILDLLQDNKKRKEYLLSIKSIASYQDSSKFCEEITKKTYSVLFENDRDLYFHVLNLLWTKDGDNYNVKDLHLSFIQKMARRYKINYR